MIIKNDVRELPEVRLIVAKRDSQIASISKNV